MQRRNPAMSFGPRSSPQVSRICTQKIAAFTLLLVLGPSPVLPTVYPGSEESDRAATAAERGRQSRHLQLERIMNYLGNPRAARRSEAAAAFANLAALHSDAHPDVRAFADWLRRDPDRDVASRGELLAARLDGRAPDPELAPIHGPSPAQLRRDRERWKALLEQAAGTAGELRRDTLRQLVEIADRENRLEDPELRAALEAARADPNSRVSTFAHFMLKWIAGDPHALGMVYVRGESQP